MLTPFFVGLILALTVSYVVYVRIPTLNPSMSLDTPTVREWVTDGRYHNFGGFAVFYHDSIGDIIRGHTFTTADHVYPDVINKPVLLLIHGLPMWSFDYEKIYPKMQDLFHVVAIDLLGNGLSDKPQDIEYTFALQADLIESVLGEIMFERRHLADTFQLDRSSADDGIHMISHDIGASVAQELLARQLNGTSTGLNVKSCVFLNGGLFAEKIVPHQPPALRKALRSKILGPVLQLLTTYKGFSASLSSIYGPNTKPTTEELRITWDAMVHKDGQYLLHKTTNYAIDRVKNTHRLVNAMLNSSRRMPMLHINGPADTIAGRHMAEEFDRRVPHASSPTVYLDPDIGHFPHLEAPQEVLATLRQFYTSDNDRFTPVIASRPAELFQ